MLRRRFHEAGRHKASDALYIQPTAVATRPSLVAQWASFDVHGSFRQAPKQA